MKGQDFSVGSRRFENRVIKHYPEPYFDIEVKTRGLLGIKMVWEWEGKVSRGELIKVLNYFVKNIFLFLVGPSWLVRNQVALSTFHKSSDLAAAGERRRGKPHRFRKMSKFTQNLKPHRCRFRICKMSI